MEKILYLICLSFVLTASDCNKEDEGCHYDIKFINNSEEAVIRATRRVKSDDPSKCILQGTLIESKGIFEYRPYNWCIEKSIGSEIIEFYVIDKDSTDLGYFYDCDSIEIYNTVLKKYELTIEGLRASNFTVNYS